jgi:hypothetical protein
VQDRGVSLQGVTGLNGVVPLPGRENRAADERQPHKKTRLVRLPPEDVCMALHRHLAISYLMSLSTAAPLGIRVFLIKLPEIIGAQDMDAVFIELQQPIRFDFRLFINNIIAQRH